MNGIFKGFLALGVIFIAIGIYLLVLAITNSDWDQIQGKIIKTNISSDVTLSNYTGRNHQIQYAVNLTYAYSINGASYQNTRVSIGSGDTLKGGFQEKSNAREWLSNSSYTIGNEVTVFVNPDSPKDTVLETGINIGTIIPIILGLFFIGFALLIRFVAKKTAENTNSTV